MTLSPREAAFALVGLPLAALGGLYVAATIYLGALLAITLVGLPLVACALLGARGLGWLHRWLVARLLDDEIEAPLPPPRASGPLDWVRSRLTDGSGWRALLYLLVRLPIGVLTFLAGIGLWVYGVFLLTVPITQAGDISSWLLVSAPVVGLAMLAAAPWASHASADLNRWLARLLLGPGPAPERLVRLEQARNEVATDANDTLRRIERDLHDGTQARLVALALSLGMAEHALDDIAGPPTAARDAAERAKSLLQRARSQLTETTIELRQLTRGINPVALEGGLAQALPTLAADAGIPCDLHYALDERPSPVIERVVYFCVAELITNAAKHSGADSVRVDVTADEKRLVVRVRDDGRGEADADKGTGLRGLRDRLRTVDGELWMSSPRGGPTVIEARLPANL